jgi:hypothetical protein
MKKRVVFSLLLVLSLVTGANGASEADKRGVLIEREFGGVLQLAIETNHMVFRFFDDQMNPLPADVDRITVRVHRSNQSQKFTVAIPYEGIDGLRAPLVIRPPHVFRGYLALMRGSGDVPVETYTVEYPNPGG